MIGSPQLYEVCREMDARGWMSVRCVVPLHQEPDISDDEIAARLPLVGERGRLWRGGTAKFLRQREGVGECAAERGDACARGAHDMDAAGSHRFAR